METFILRWVHLNKILKFLFKNKILRSTLLSKSRFYRNFSKHKNEINLKVIHHCWKWNTNRFFKGQKKKKKKNSIARKHTFAPHCATCRACSQKLLRLTQLSWLGSASRLRILLFISLKGILPMFYLSDYPKAEIDLVYGN